MPLFNDVSLLCLVSMEGFHIRRTIFHENIMELSNNYPLLCTPGPRDSPHRIGSGYGTGPLDYESRNPVPDPETFPLKYFFGQRSFYLEKNPQKKQNKKQNKTKQTNKRKAW